MMRLSRIISSSTRFASSGKMRFCQFRNGAGDICLGAETTEGKIADISAIAGSLKALIEQGDEGMSKVAAAIATAVATPRDQLQIAPAIHDPQKIICVGLNYSDHCTEQNKPIPKEPVIFNKFPSAIIAAGEQIELPKIGCNTDLEGELAVIIGKEARHVAKEDAMDYIFGYTIANDVSGRDWQKKRNGGQWLLGKTFDTFCPLGPIVDTGLNPSSLSIKSWIDDDLMQDSNTKFLIFDIPFIINWLSQICTLKPGDVILTGTPGGVGMHRNPPKFLQEGQTCTVEIEGLGKLVNPVAMEK